MQRKLPTLVTAFITTGICAPQVQALDLNWGGSLNSDFSDNGRRVAVNPESERQDNIGLNIAASDQMKYVQYDLGYNWSYTNFSKDSQEDRSLLDGDASVTLGKRLGLFQVVIDHSRRKSLIDPTQQNLFANLEERDITTVSPRLNLPLSRIDIVTLSAQKSQVSYAESSLRNSQTTGADIVYRHNLSAVDSISVSFSNQDIEYTEIENYTYNYQLLAFGYQAQLRNLSYSLSAGYNEVEQNGDKFGGLNYQVELEYDLTGAVFTASAAREITDNSSGSGAAINISGDALADGRFDGPDQYLREFASASLAFGRLCTRCTLDFGFSIENETYRNFSVNDTRETNINSSFDYRLTTRSTSSISYVRRNQEFINDSIGSRASAEVRVNYRYQVNDNVNASFAVSNLEQDITDNTSATENRIGLGIDYRY